jgi:hypothetical protein
MLIFQQFIHSWLCYELVKVLYVFGLQPQIISDISDWSQALHTTFNFFNNKQQEHKEMSLKVLNTLFTKLSITATSIKSILKNPTLCFVILTWLRQLQQCFFENSEQDPLRDWNKYGCYYGTGTGSISGRPMLSNINMSTVKSETRTPVTDMYHFKPNKAKDDVITSLEEWTARVLKPDITDIPKVAKRGSNTKRRFWGSKNPTNFQLTDTDYITTGNKVCDKTPTYNCLPVRNSDKTTNELLLNISSVIKSDLTSVQKKQTNNSKRLSQGAIIELQTTHEGASSLIVLVNQMHCTNFQGLEKMHVHLQKNDEMAENKQNKTCVKLQSWELDSNSDFVDKSESESD